MPLIVPPVFDKTAYYFNNSMRTQWRIAKTSLGQADRVFVVGYSLPPTDLSTDFMLRSAFQQNSAQVTVINRQSHESEHEKQRFLDTLEGEQDRLEFRPVDKSQSSVERLLEILQ